MYLFVDNEHWYLGSIFTWIKYLYSLILTGIESLDVCCAENLPQRKPRMSLGVVFICVSKSTWFCTNYAT